MVLSVYFEDGTTSLSELWFSLFSRVFLNKKATSTKPLRSFAGASQSFRSSLKTGFANLTGFLENVGKLGGDLVSKSSVELRGMTNDPKPVTKMSKT